MKTYFEKMLFWEEFIDLFSDEKMNVICNTSTEKRADNEQNLNQLRNRCSINKLVLDYNYDKDCFLFNGKEYNLKASTYCFVQSLNVETPLLINITSMNLRLMGTLLFNIKKIGFNKVYCMYTEPGRYCKAKSGENAEEGIFDSFDLYKKFRGIEAIPGYLRANDNRLVEKWIVFMGFDSKRVEQINEKYEFNDIVPVITLPSYRPGWQNYALAENLDFIKNVERKPEYIVANSVISAYDYLTQIKEMNNQTYLKISPLGTKINALGALLFSLNNQRNVEILYDNPNEEGKVSVDRGKTYIFDITEIINEEEQR